MVLDHQNRIMLVMTPREEEDQKRLHFQNPPLWMVCLLAYMSHSQMLGKFEYGGGPIFKVVIEC